MESKKRTLFLTHANAHSFSAYPSAWLNVTLFRERFMEKRVKRLTKDCRGVSVNFKDDAGVF